MEQTRRQMEHSSEMERARLEGKIADVSEELSRRLQQSLFKVSEESAVRCQQLQKVKCR